MSPNTFIGHHVSIGAGSVLRSVTVENEVVIGVKCVPTRARPPPAQLPRRRTHARLPRPRARVSAADASPLCAPGRPAGAF
jgi:serine acetyltransferase